MADGGWRNAVARLRGRSVARLAIVPLDCGSYAAALPYGTRSVCVTAPTA